MGSEWLVVWAFSAVGPAALGQWQAIRLHPPDAAASEVDAISPTQQFGTSTLGTPGHYYEPGFWNGSAGSWTSLVTPGNGGYVLGVAGDQLGGWVDGHATIWEGPSHAPVDLHPAGYYSSQVSATTGQLQAGWLAPAVGGANSRAAVWHGSAESMTVLHPAGAFESEALAADGDRQGGWVRFYQPNGIPGDYHAVVWSGSAESLVDLSPAGSQGSIIRGMAAGQLVGTVDDHAALWPSIGSPYIDLDPPSVSGAELYATCGTAQVGQAVTNYGGVAAIWFGSAASLTPLNFYLPPGYSASGATCVAEQNGVFYVGGWAANTATGHFEAFMWVGVPAPGSLALLVGAGVLGGRRRR